MRKITPSSGTIERISRLGLQANKGWIVGLAPPAEPAWPKIVFVPTSLRPADAGATAGTPGRRLSPYYAGTSYLICLARFSTSNPQTDQRPHLKNSAHLSNFLTPRTVSVLSQSFSLFSVVPDHTVRCGTVLSRDAFPGTSCQATIGVVPPGRAGRHFATASSQSLLRIVPEGRCDRSLARSAWKNATQKSPSRRVRCDRVRSTRTRRIGTGR